MFKFNKLVAFALIAQSLMGSVVFASEGTTTSLSAEEQYLSQVIALRGSKVSSATVQSQLTEAYKTYDSSAPKEGRNERLEKALVDMNISTPAQVAEIDAQVNAPLENSNEAIANRVMQIGQTLQGAQFSKCAIDVNLWVWGGVLMIGGLVTKEYTMPSSDNPISGNASASHDGQVVLELGGAMEVAAFIFIFYGHFSCFDDNY